MCTQYEHRWQGKGTIEIIDDDPKHYAFSNPYGAHLRPVGFAVEKEAALAAHRTIVTVEELVDELTPVPGAIVLPAWVASGERRTRRPGSTW